MAIENTNLDEQLKKIEEKIDAIEEKLSEKWFLPVFITVLTSILAIFTFFVQRSYTNSDVNQNKQREIIGQFVADSKIAFYKGCKNQLNNINEQFESYCKFGHAKEVEVQIDSSLVSFRKFIMSQQVIDQNVIETAKRYAEFISESTFDISLQNLDKAASIRYYNESQILFDESMQTLNNSMQKILNQ